jgi:ATP-dependent Clp protease ATP-binding subunit ClpC
MFEHFTDRARRVMVLSQEEARMFGHNWVGTEHILLGLLHEGTGVAAKALMALGFSLAEARTQIAEIVGHGDPADAPTGHIAFTPRAKKVLELASRESRELGHDYVGTEHILLGLMREGDGAGAQVLNRAGTDYPAVRDQVLQLLHGHQGDDVPPAEVRPGELRRAELWFDASGRAGRDIGRRLASLDARLAVIERRLRERLPEAEGQLDRAA